MSIFKSASSVSEDALLGIKNKYDMIKDLTGFLLSVLMMTNLSVDVFAQDKIEYYSIDFTEGIPEDMSMYDVDGQTLHYTMIQAGFKQGEAWMDKRENKGDNRYAASACRYKIIDDNLPAASNDWLVTPHIWIRADDAVLSWKAMSVNNTLDVGAGYEVRISSVGSNPEDFTSLPVYTTQEELINEWAEHEVSLGEFVGQRIYIAFVNNSSTGEIIGIDDVKVEGSKGVCDLEIKSERYVYGENEVRVKGCLEACSDEVITDVTIKCQSKNQEIISSYNALALKRGDVYEFELPTSLQVNYGETIDYQVVAEINNSIVIDPVKCQATALMYKFHKNIVVEEATGMWCTYCPAGIVAMEELEKKYPNSFIGLALHYNDQLGVDDYVMDLSFPDGFPTGWINRKYYTSPMVEVEEDNVKKYTTLNGGFETFYLQELAVPPVAEVVLSSEPVGNSLEVKTDLRFAMDLNDADYRLAYVLIENNVSGDGYYQVNGYSEKNVEIGGFENLPEIIYDIKFQHVVREIYDDWQGVSGSVPSEIKGGDVYSHNYVVELPTTINDVNNVELVVMLIDMTTGQIVNADKVNASTEVEMIEIGRPILNCVVKNESIKVDVIGAYIDNLNISLYDIHGRLVDMKQTCDSSVVFSNISNPGVYIVELKYDNHVITKKVIIG